MGPQLEARLLGMASVRGLPLDGRRRLDASRATVGLDYKTKAASRCPRLKSRAETTHSWQGYEALFGLLVTQKCGLQIRAQASERKYCAVFVLLAS